MKKLYMSCLLLAAMGLHSCNDDDIANRGVAGEPLTPGAAVDFGVGLSRSASQSRTVYGEEDTENQCFPIFWTFSEDDSELDHIFIQSPDARYNKRAEYRVKPSEDKDTKYCPVEAVDEKSRIAFGDGTHAFYGFYPSSAVIREKLNGVAENIIYAEMPSTQVVTYGELDQTNTYVAAHSMDYCFMTSAVPNVTTQPVQLMFDPWASVLDITLPGPGESDTEDSYKITEVVIRSLAQANANSDEKAQEIAGSFKYDFASDVIDFESVEGHCAPSHVLTVKICDKNDNEGIVLEKGQKLNFKAFLLPVDLMGLSVEVSNGEGTMWSVTLNKPDDANRTGLLLPGHVHKVVLPALNSEKTQVDLSTWISGMKDGTRITDLSIPGSYDSFSYLFTPTGTTPKIQTVDINDQFQAGIRAFNVRVLVKDGSDGYISGGGGKYLGVTIDGSNVVLPLGEALTLVYNALQENSPNDFCVVSIIHDEADTSTNREYYTLLKQYADDMAGKTICPARAFDSDLTIKQLRGYVLLQGQVNGGPSTDMAEYWASTQSNNATLCPYYNIEKWIGNSGATIIDHYGTDVTGSNYEDIGPKSWSPLEGAPMLLSWSYRYDDNITGITPMTYGNIGSYTYNNISDAAAYDMEGRSSVDDIALYQNDNARPAAPAPDAAQATSGKYGLAYINARMVYDNADPHGSPYVTIPGGDENNRLYKSNVHFDPGKIVDKYSGWINSFTDENYFWLADGYVSYKNDDAQVAWSRIAYMWKKTNISWDKVSSWGGASAGGVILNEYQNCGGRMLISTYIGTHATKNDFLRDQRVDPVDVYDATHLIFLSYFRMFANNPNNITQAWKLGTWNVAYNFYNGRYNFVKSNNIRSEFINQALGIVYMPCVPAKGVNIDSSINTFQNTDKFHARQLIDFLVDQSVKMNKN